MQADLSLTRTLRSRRFDLAPLGLDDASLFAELAEDTEIVKYLVGDWSTARKRLENARAWICEDFLSCRADCVPSKYRPRPFLFLFF